jgi:hypothetical protein
VLTPEQEQLYGPRVELPGGLLLKQFGKVAQWGGPDDTDPNTWGVRVVVDSVEVDPKCGEYTSPPTRGHRLVVSLRAETSSSYEGPFGEGVLHGEGGDGVGGELISGQRLAESVPRVDQRAGVGVELLGEVAEWDVVGDVCRTGGKVRHGSHLRCDQGPRSVVSTPAGGRLRGVEDRRSHRRRPGRVGRVCVPM